MQSQMQSQRLALPPEAEVGPSIARAITKEICIDPSGQDPERETWTNVGCMLMIVLPNWLLLEEFMRGRQLTTMFLWSMIK